jgi:hypothetical protein
VGEETENRTARRGPQRGDAALERARIRVARALFGPDADVTAEAESTTDEVPSTPPPERRDG